MNKNRDGKLKENKDMTQYCTVTFKQFKAYMIKEILITTEDSIPSILPHLFPG